MSHKATAWAYAQPVTPAGRKFVLIVLADFADEANSCYPGQAKIAAMTGMSVASVARHLKDLEESGLISRSRRITQAGHRTSDRYTLPVESYPAKREVGPEEQGPTLQNDGSLPVNLSGPTPQFAGGTIREPLGEPLDARAKPRRRPETPIPPDFQPTQGHVAYAAEHHLDLSSELMRFRTHAAANDRRLRDWTAGFTMWLSKAKSFDRPNVQRAANDLRPEGW